MQIEHSAPIVTARDRAPELELTEADRSAIISSVIASQALEGVHVPRETAARLLDEVLREPLRDIG
jgi:hypothetical protein